MNVDLQAGHGVTPAELEARVQLCVETGVAGLSIEDRTADGAKPLFELSMAVERVEAARRAIDASGGAVLLTARAECYLVGHPQPLAESIRRLRAYAEAGADVLYAPGPTTREDIRAVVKAVAPKPVNVVMAAHTGSRLGTSPRWAFGASASAPLSRVQPGPASDAPRKRWPTGAASRGSKAASPTPS